MWREYVAHRLIGTPAEPMVQRVRRWGELRRRWRYPELAGVMDEPGWIVRLIDGYVHDPMNCIDVGCHLGSVLSQLVRRSPSGQHLVVEPVAYKAAWLRRKFAGVRVEQVALSDEAGEATFYYQPHRSGFSGLRAGRQDQRTREMRVTCVQLDDLAAGMGPIGFIKLDVEGGELAALRGGRGLLERDRPMVLFECTRAGLAGFDLQPRDMYDFFVDELGYRIYMVKAFVERGRPLTLAAFGAAMTYPFQAYNFVAADARGCS